MASCGPLQFSKLWILPQIFSPRNQKFTKMALGSSSKNISMDFFGISGAKKSSFIHSRELKQRYIKHVLLDSFYVTGLYLYPLKTSEKLWFSDVFRGYGRDHWLEMGKSSTVFHQAIKQCSLMLTFVYECAIRLHFQPFKDQCSHHIETSQLICSANQLTSFYMMGILVVKRLIWF